MTMGNPRELAWVIYVARKVLEVYITTGSDDAMAEQQATGRTNIIAKSHVAGAVYKEGPFPVTRK
jgi:hypothetical protein